MDPERESSDGPGGDGPELERPRRAYRSGLLTAAHRIRAAGFLRDATIEEWLEDQLTELEDEGDGKQPLTFVPDKLELEPPQSTGP